MPVDVAADCSAELAGLLERAGRLLLEATGHGADRLSIAIVNDEEIRRLNRDYRASDRATDVLSFSQEEGDALIDAGARDAPHELGDVVVSLETAARQAKIGNWQLQEELVRLLLHGVLHLLGYDHEGDPGEARKMRAAEQRLARVLHEAGLPCAWQAEEAR